MRRVARYGMILLVIILLGAGSSVMAGGKGHRGPGHKPDPGHHKPIPHHPGHHRGHHPMGAPSPSEPTHNNYYDYGTYGDCYGPDWAKCVPGVRPKLN